MLSPAWCLENVALLNRLCTVCHMEFYTSVVLKVMEWQVQDAGKYFLCIFYFNPVRQ